MKTLESERLALRAMEPEDLDFLYRWENDDSLWAYGSTITPFSRFILREYIGKVSTDLYESRQLRLMIEEKEMREPIGTIDLYDFEPYHNRAGVGILLDGAFQGQGYATEALNQLKEYAFGLLQLNQLYAFIPSENIASLHLFRRCGFAEAGVLKRWNKSSTSSGDVYIYQCLSK